MKENLAFFSLFLLKNCEGQPAELLQPYYQTATDVLRLLAAMSDGDISLAESPKIRKLSRAERRMIMDLLAGIKNPLEDMFHYREEWIRVGERIHPGEYQSEKYAAVRENFRKIRNNEKPLFFGGQVEQLLLSGDTLAAARLLSRRPGEFVRRLDMLFRRAEEEEEIQEEILKLFQEVGDKVSIPVLFQAMNHFDHRDEGALRVFFPKGMLSKAMGIPRTFSSLNVISMLRPRTAGVCRMLIRRQFEKKPPMGKVYISKEMKNYPIPFSQRSASSGNKLLVRGTRIDIDDDVKVIRAFIHWTNTGKDTEDERVDIDLSATFYDRNWNYVSHISYTDLEDDYLGAYHSGDIVNGGPIDGPGAAEFIDIDIDSAKEVAPYVVFQVYAYTEQTFKTLPNVRFGWMQREKPESGEIFEPKTVDSVFGLSADSTAVIPVILNCRRRELIWCDIIKTGRNWYYGNNLESNLFGVTAIAYAMKE